MVAAYVELGARVLVAGAFVLSGIVAATHWAVRNRRLNAFSGWARFVRGWSDPLIKPVERRVVRAGANPQDAPFWLIGVVILGGLALIALVRWLIGFVATILYSVESGGAALLPMFVSYAFGLLMAAILVRVIGSWFGVGRYNRLMRVVYAMTDWLIEPLQRVVPTLGPFDITPIVAYLLLSVTRKLVLGAFF